MRRLIKILSLPLLLLTGYGADTYNECVVKESKGTKALWAVNAMCREDFPLINPPWYQLGTKKAQFTYKKDNRCYRVRVSSELAKSTAKWDVLRVWFQSLNDKQRNKYRC